MFKAVHRESGEEVLTLHPAWRGRKDELRRLTAAGLLVCQGCRQAVRLKAGPRKRPHFAHLHLQGCSYGQESPRVLAARALLYEWLSVLLPGRVEAEAALPGLNRPVDVLLRLEDGEVVYWVVDALMKQQARQDLRAVFERENLRPVWVFCSNLLCPEAGHAARLYLSPGERDCLAQTAYDEIGKENRISGGDFGSSLHYLDIETARLITFRSLERVHAPNIFAGRRVETPLDDVCAGAGGEPVHPGEERDLGASRRARARQAERVRQWLAPSPRAPAPKPAPAPALAAGEPDEAARCIYCGELTRDWWAAWNENGQRLGKCRDCLEKGLG